MEYTNPLMGLAGPQITSTPDTAEPSVPTPASTTGNGGAKKAQKKMRPSKSSTAR